MTRTWGARRIHDGRSPARILRSRGPMRHFTCLSIIFTFFLFSAGCASDATTSTTAPTPATTTDTFSGTVGQLATAGNPFVVSADGPVTIGLTSGGPLAA